MWNIVKQTLLTPQPNQLTAFRMLLAPFLAVVMIFQAVYLSLILFIIASLTDWWDGYLARKSNTITATGKFLDPLADKLVVSTAFGILAYLDGIHVWMFIAIVGRDILITSLRSYAVLTRKPFETSNFAKWKTASQMVAIYLLLLLIIAQQDLPIVVNYLGAGAENLKDWPIVYNLMFVITGYTIATGVSYMLENRHLLKDLAVACYRAFVPIR